MKFSSVTTLLTKPTSHIVILLLFSLCLIFPYFHAGYFPTHDGEWAVVRLAEMYRALTDGQFPVRYSTYLNYNYGYPLFNFAYPLPYYLGAPVASIIGFVNTTKLIFAISIPLSAIGMYLASRKIWDCDGSGVVAGALYILAPYRLVDLYVRGSIGECVSFAIAPFLLYVGLLLLERKNNFFLISLFALLLGALITTHNIMGLYFTPIIAIILVSTAFSNNTKRWGSLVLAFLLGVGLSAFFLVPVLFEKGNILLAQIPIAERSLNWVYPGQLLFSDWGYGVPPNEDSFTVALGLGQVIIMIGFLTLFLTKFFWREKIQSKIIVATLTVLWVLTLLMMFPPTNFIWENIPLLKEINYPWTLLGPLVFLTAVSAGWVTLNGKEGKILAGASIFVAALFTIGYANPEKYINNPDTYYMTNDATTTSSKEYTPLWVKELPLEMPKQRIYSQDENIVITQKVYASNEIAFDVKADEGTEVVINTIYYPGWQALVNGNLAQIDYSNNRGIMVIPIDKGESSVVLKFSETPARSVANTASLVALFVVWLLPFYSLFKWKKR